MFFPRLRRQAKWMFVFLALVFAVGFVGFGVGSGGSGLDALWSNLGGAPSGPSVKDAQEKIDDGNLAAYKELSEAYRADGKVDEGILAGEEYIKARPKDFDFMRALASDYEGKANRQRDEASIIQEELTASTGGTTFGISPTSKLGQALGTGRIDQELTSAANQKLTELFSGLQSAYQRAAELYQRVATVNRDDVLLHMLLGNAAYQARQNPTALAAYDRVCKLAPDSLDCRQAKDQSRLIRAEAATSSGAPGSG